MSQLTKLEILSLMGCSEIRNLPQLPPNLISLNLSSTKIKKLSPSIQGLSQLEDLLLCGCEELESLPDSISELKNLKDLDLGGCVKLFSLSANLGDLESLETLFIEGRQLNNLPVSINRLSLLMELSCPGYKGDALPSLKNLVSLSQLNLQRSNLMSLPEDIKHLTNLLQINLSNCKILSVIPELPSNLRYLDASNCTSLKKYTHNSLREVDYRNDLRSKPEQLQLKFTNCFNLEQDARKGIWRDFWQRLQFVMVPLVEKMYDKQIPVTYESSSQIERPLFLSAGVCFPGYEVPEWFKYSQIGSSLQVKTNFRRRLDPLRFIFCAAVSFPHNFNRQLSDIIVMCNCQTKSGENFYSASSYSLEDKTVQLQTVHIMLWCDHFGRSQFYFTEAVFQFSVSLAYEIDKDNQDQGQVAADYVAIVKCAVTPVGRTFGTKWLPVIRDGDSPVVEERASLPKRSEKRKSASHAEGLQPSNKSMKRCKGDHDQQEGTCKCK